MASLTDVIKQKRSSGQSRTGSLLGSLKDKFKEKIDPRKFLNQTGVLTALFPSLKAYKATGASEESVQKSGSLSPQSNNTTLVKISSDSGIAAKNMSLLPSISRDINVMKQNVIKFAKSAGVKTTDKADSFFLKQSESEKLYENQKTNSNIELEGGKTKTNKKSFSWLKLLSMVGIGASSLLLIDFLFRKKDSVVYKLYEKLKSKVEDFVMDIQDFIVQSYDGVEVGLNAMVDGVEKNMSEAFDSLSNMISLDNIKDMFTEGGPTAQIDNILDQAKEKTSTMINSMVPSAQAATVPTSREIGRASCRERV
jgi:hypothetical protein